MVSVLHKELEYKANKFKYKNLEVISLWNYCLSNSRDSVLVHIFQKSYFVPDKPKVRTFFYSLLHEHMTIFAN